MRKKSHILAPYAILRDKRIFIYLFLKFMNQHEYALDETTQQDLTIQCGTLAMATAVMALHYISGDTGILS